VRVVGDEERAIVDALNALRHRYTYVFTTGGIGPTHGEITADCVAKASGVLLDWQCNRDGGSALDHAGDAR
jgi:molybdopterin-biosynthesis enzyme MoeA-like protein